MKANMRSQGKRFYYTRENVLQTGLKTHYIPHEYYMKDNIYIKVI